MRPSVDKTVFDHQAQQKKDHDAGARFRECLVREQVLAYNHRSKHGKKVWSWKEVAQPLMWYKCKERCCGRGILTIFYTCIIIAASDTIAQRANLPHTRLACTSAMPGMADVPPVNMTNPGQDTTEGAVPLSETTLTQGTVTSSSTPNSEESEPMVDFWDRLFEFAPFTFIAVLKVCTNSSVNPLEEGLYGAHRISLTQKITFSRLQ